MKRIKLHNPTNLGGGTVSATFLGEQGKKLADGEEVQLVDVNDQDLMFAEIVNAWVGPLVQAPASLLEMSHDPLQRTFAGVHMHLIARRPTEETVVNQETVITILVMRDAALQPIISILRMI